MYLICSLREMQDEILWAESSFTKSCTSIPSADLISYRKFNADNVFQDLALVKITKKKAHEGNPIASKANINFYFNDESHEKGLMKVEVKMNNWHSSISMHGIVPEGVKLSSVLQTINTIRIIVWGEKYLDIVHDPYENQIDAAISELNNENSQSRRSGSKRTRIPRIQKKLQSRVGEKKVLLGRRTQSSKAGEKTGKVRNAKS